MASAAVGNLAFILTAKTGRFAADMRNARKPLVDLQRTVRSVRNSIRVVFAAVALRGFVSWLTSAVGQARKLGVYLDMASRKKVGDLARSYQALAHVLTRLSLKIVAAVSPALQSLIAKLTYAAIWIERRLTPGNIKLARTLVSLSAAALAAAAAFKVVVAVQRVWNNATKIAVVLQATLAAISGNWVALAAGAAVFGATLYGINRAFGDMERDATGDLKSIGAEIDRLQSKMLGVREVAVGRMGVDFATFSSQSGTAFRDQIDRMNAPQAQAIGRFSREVEKQRREDFEWRRRTETFGGRFHYSRGMR